MMKAKEILTKITNSIIQDMLIFMHVRGVARMLRDGLCNKTFGFKDDYFEIKWLCIKHSTRELNR